MSAAALVASHPRLLVTLTLALASVLFFAHLTVSGKALFWGIPLLQLYPWRSFAVAEYLGGSVPLWNPYAGFGMPLAANLQSAVFYPLNFFYLLLPNERAQTVSLVLHVAIAGLTSYGLCRSLWCGRLPATAGAFSFMFSGFIVAQGSFHNITTVLAWIPALFWGVNVMLDTTTARSRALAAVGLAAATGLLITGGFVQYAYYGLVAAAAFGAYRLWPWLPDWGGTLRRGAPPAAVVLLGVGLAAVQLGPTLELTGHSVRQAGLGFDEATSASLWPGLLLTTVLPGLFGSQPTNDWRAPGTPYEGVLFLGALPLIAAVIGARSGLPHRRFFLVLAGAGLFLALGRHNPIFPILFEAVPGLSLFHAPARFTLWYLVGMTVLAAMGVQAVQSGSMGVRRPGSMSVAAGIALVTAGLAAGLMPGASAWIVSAGMAITTGGVWLAGAGVVLLARQRMRPGGWGLAATAFIAINLYVLGHGLVPGTDASLYTQPPSDGAQRLQAEAGLDRTWTSDMGYLGAQQLYFNFSGFWTTEADRLMRMRDQLVPNLGTPLGLYEAHNYDPLKLSRPALLQGAVQNAGFPPHLLDLMGVRYLPTSSGVEAPGARLAYLIGQAPLYERQAPLPRAFVVPRSVRAESAPHALEEVMRPSFDPRTAVVLEAPLEVTLPAGSGDFRPATIQEYAHQRVVVAADGGSSGGVLVLTDAYYPGWHATLDGAEATIYPVDAAFRGLLLPPGHHVVEFTYKPMSVMMGAAVSGAALTLLTGLLVFGFTRPRA